MICKLVLLITFLNIPELIFCTQLSGSKYCYVSLIIQLNISHLFALSLNSETSLFNPLIEAYHVLTLRVRVDLGAIAMKGYSTFPKFSRLQPRHQIILCHIQDTRVCGGVLPPIQRCNRCILQPQPTGLWTQPEKEGRTL